MVGEGKFCWEPRPGLVGFFSSLWPHLAITITKIPPAISYWLHSGEGAFTFRLKRRSWSVVARASTVQTIFLGGPAGALRRLGGVWVRRWALTVAAVCFWSWQSGTGYAQVSVLTYHNDVSRTGQNLNETILTPANVNQNQFGKLISYNVDGFVVAQPLYIQNISIPNLGSHNVVYVATLHDSVYAFDADNLNPNALPLWRVSFINPAMGITTVSGADAGCTNVTKFTEHGIVGTPVIDPSSGTLYVIAKTNENGTYVQRLHALDVGTGQEKFGGPVVISASVSGTGDGSSTVTFSALNQMSRPGLLLLNNTIYVLFGANGCKQVHNHGWALAYDAQTLQQTGVFNTTPNDNNGGSWQAGSGPAADSSGNIYFETADALFDANTGGADFGDSILKLTPGNNGLLAADYFTPLSQALDNLNDLDLGSVGPLVLPDQPGPYPHLLIGSGKAETIYLVNRDNMGGYSATQDQIVQEVPAAFTRQRDGVPTYWNGMVYFEQFSSPVIAYSLSNGLLSTAPVTQTGVGYSRNYPSSISANGTTNGILWLVTGNSGTAFTLRAFDPTNLATEFYDSDQAGTRDTLSPPAHWATPTIANGKVYVGTQTQLVIYGLQGLAPIAAPTPTSLSFTGQNVGTTSAPRTITLTNTGSAMLAVSSVLITGPNAGDFEQTNDCSTNIAPGNYCTIDVTFSPTAANGRSGAVTITDNAGNSPQSVSLTGTGFISQVPMVSLSPNHLDFGNQRVATTSSISTSTLTNTGTGTLAISSVVSSGDFGLATTSTSCPYTGGVVNVGASCTIDVTFTPSQSGNRAGSIAVTDNAPDSPETVGLTGAGVQGVNPVPLLSLPLSPAAAAPEGAAFLLAVTGVNFVPGSVVNWNGSPRTTSFVASSRLTATISASDITSAGTALITVVTPTPGGGTSNVGFFEITSPIATVSFGRSDLDVGTNPVAVAAGDFNSDGKLDLVVANSGSNNVSVLLGNGDGTFHDPTSNGVGSTPTSLAVADFNNDGKLDLVVTTSSNSVMVLLGNGDGTFQNAVGYGADTAPHSVAAGDFNGDGALDLAVTNANSNDVSILLGNGDGTFQTAVNYGVSNIPSSIGLGDFNGDGHADLVVANQGSNNISILLGNGDGTFQTAINHSAGSTPNSLAVADFNSDGMLDLVTANNAGNNVSVLLASGNAAFQIPVNYGVSAGPSSVASGDFDGDGKLDLVVANTNSNNVGLLLGYGDGTFQTAVNNGVGANPDSIAVGDFNGDGRLDMAVANSGDGTLSVLSQIPVATLSAASLTFANQIVDSTSTPQNVTLTNNGSAPLSVASVGVLGNNAADFTQTNTCNGTITAGGYCTIAVTFTPSVTGSRSATLAVNDNASGGQQTVSLSGAGVQASSTVSLSASVNPSAFDQTVGLTATVTPQFGGQATGTVTFMDGTTPLGNAGVNGNVAALNISTLVVGSHTITASYSGDSNFRGNTSPGLPQAVNQATTTSTLTASPDPSTIGQSVLLVATVAGQFGGTPTGTVTFKGGANFLGTSTVNNGQATLNFAFKTSGVRSVIATYSGNPNFLTSASAPVQQTVNKVPTTTVVTSSQNPSSFSQLVTFTAVVSSGSGNPPDGEVVTFKDGTTKLGTGTLSGGMATYTTSTLKRGAHNITATYGGDTILATSTSTALQQTVQQATSTTVLASSPDPSTIGQSVLLVATVAGQFGGTPTGTVTFKGGANFLGTSTVNNGQATLNFAFKTSGVRSVIATYSGDPNFLTSASAPVQQTVNKVPTTTVVTSSQNPSSFGQLVTFTAAVISASGNPPDGEVVTFKDGTTKLGTGTLSGGMATYTTSTLKRGAHNITATYGGDTILATSTSTALPQTVN